MNSFCVVKILCIFMQVNLYSSVSTNSTEDFLPYSPGNSEAYADSQLISFQEAIEESTTSTHSLLVGLPSETDLDSRRWQNGFFVQPDPEFNDEEVQLINSALYDLQQVLCIPVKVWSQDLKPSGDYVFIRKGENGSGCSSPVGRQGGQQVMNLEAINCMTKPKIIHESIHALGFHHEHNRPDRDKYIDMLLENVKPGHEHNFKIAEDSLTFGVPYDYNSIMHYWSTAFSKDEELPTMLRKDGTDIEFNQVISSYDALKIKRMYNCNSN